MSAIEASSISIDHYLQAYGECEALNAPHTNGEEFEDDLEDKDEEHGGQGQGQGHQH